MSTPRHPYLAWEGPLPFAHRGGASDVPENTLEAFEYAIKLGYRYLETDVQVTADGVLAAFHDNDLLRTTGHTGKISEMPWSEVSKALVDGKAPIPRLEDLLGTWPEARINIDCKSDAAVDALVAALRRTNSLTRVCVGAFNDLRLRRLRSVLGAELCTSLGPIETALLRFGLLRNPPGLAAQVPVKEGPLTVVNRRFVERAHRLGLHVHVWTIDDAAEMRRLLDLGVDGIMTDCPIILRDVLQSRGAWKPSQ
jgi:glycerophosphoryl diester phosphodiesterase